MESGSIMFHFKVSQQSYFRYLTPQMHQWPTYISTYDKNWLMSPLLLMKTMASKLLTVQDFKSLLHHKILYIK